jgi:hypothetical protein
MLNLKSLLVIIFTLLTALPAYKAISQARTPKNIIHDLEKATGRAVATYKESGMSGLEVNVLDCYKNNKNKYYCLYYDLASRRIDQLIAEEMHFPPNDFFADEKFGGRIGPILAKLNMGNIDTANQYLATTTPVVNKMVENRLLGNK